MKNLKGGIVVLMMTIVAACSSTPSDPHKPEMSVDTGPAHQKPTIISVAIRKDKMGACWRPFFYQ